MSGQPPVNPGPPYTPPGAPGPPVQYQQPYPQQPYPQQHFPYAAPQQGNGIAIAGGVCGIVAVVLCWIPFIDYLAVVLGALAIIFGFIGLQRANRTPGAPAKGMAITGIVTGIVAVAISLIFIIAIYAAISSLHGQITTG